MRFEIPELIDVMYSISEWLLIACADALDLIYVGSGRFCRYG